jgi:outer membrane protein
MMVFSAFAGAAVRLPVPRMTEYTHLTPADIPKPLPQRWGNRVVGRYLPSALTPDGLPPPLHMSLPTKLLTMQEAILLALRNNPAVINAQLQRIEDKFQLEIARNAFMPQISALTLGGKWAKGAKPDYGSFNPSVSLTNGYGTKIILGASSDFSGKPSANVEIDQPLLSGFDVPRQTYLAALDTEKGNKLKYASSIVGVVNSVTQSYIQLVQAKIELKNQAYAVNQQVQELARSQKKLAVGRVSRSSLRSQQSTLMQSKLSYQQQKSSIDNTYQGFLQTLGLSPESKLNLPSQIDVRQLPMKIPSFNAALRFAFAHNNAYRQTVLGMMDAQRAVISTRDAAKWTLGATYNYNYYPNQDASQSLQNKSLGSVPAIPVGPIPPTEEHGGIFGLNLTIPIETLSTRSGLVSARIGYEEAKINLRKSKQDLLRKIMQDYQNIRAQKNNITLAKQGLVLQQQVLKDTQLQYHYGKTTDYFVAAQRKTLLDAQQQLVSAQVNYFTAVQALHDDMGDTLSVWHIRLRY